MFEEIKYEHSKENGIELLNLFTTNRCFSPLSIGRGTIKIRLEIIKHSGKNTCVPLIIQYPLKHNIFFRFTNYVIRTFVHAHKDKNSKRGL